MYWSVVDVVALVSKVVSTQQMNQTDHEFVIDFPDDFPRIEADPDKLDQILTNLLNNASSILRKPEDHCKRPDTRRTWRQGCD